MSRLRPISRRLLGCLAVVSAVWASGCQGIPVGTTGRTAPVVPISFSGAKKAPAGAPRSLPVAPLPDAGVPEFLPLKPRWLENPRLVLNGSMQDDARGYTGAYLLRVEGPPEVWRPHVALENTQVLRQRALGAGWVVRVRPPANEELATWQSRLRMLPGFVNVEREARRWTLQAPPNDPFFSRQWAHRPEAGDTLPAWNLVSPEAQASVVVAVLDTGLDVTHPEFAGRVVAPHNAVDDNQDVTDLQGHGTHVSGIICARGNDAQGVAGVAWGVRIKPIKVFPDLGFASDFDIMDGFMNALEWTPVPDDGSRVRVINMSLGADTSAVSSLWLELAQLARARGVVVVAASGNSNLPFVGSPANTPGILAVGSSMYHAGWEGVSAFSNGGDALDLVAPGEDILSTVPGGYAPLSGTSMAAPYVAGVAALLAARYDPLNTQLDADFVTEVERRLRLAVDDLDAPGPDPLAGQGRLNAGRALVPATLAEDP